MNVDADSIPRMAEPVLKKVRCSICERLVYDFEQDYATGDIYCEECLDVAENTADDDVEEEEEDDGQY